MRRERERGKEESEVVGEAGDAVVPICITQESSAVAPYVLPLYLSDGLSE